MITNNIVLEILKGVCLSVDQVPKLIQNFFSTMEQKFIQCCETEIVADACIASYQKNLLVCLWVALKIQFRDS